MSSRKYFCEDCQKEVVGKLVSRCINYSFRKESFEMTETVMLCDCGYELYDEDLANQSMKKLTKLYEERVGLGSQDIKEIRLKTNLSMELFARILGWSKATIVRYENGQNIPDVSHQAILKLIKDSPNFLLDYYADKKESFTNKEQNKIESALTNSPNFDVNTVAEEAVQYQVENKFPNIFTGYTNFVYEKVVSMVLFFSGKGVNKIKLMRCLFYSDFLYYKRYTNSISGLRYKKLPDGPIPEKHDTLLEKIEGEDYIKVENTINGEYVKIIVKANREPELVLFNDYEIEVLQLVAEKFKDFELDEITDFTLKEKGLIETSNFEIISYAFSETLMLD